MAGDKCPTRAAAGTTHHTCATDWGDLPANALPATNCNACAAHWGDSAAVLPANALSAANYTCATHWDFTQQATAAMAHRV